MEKYLIAPKDELFLKLNKINGYEDLNKINWRKYFNEWKLTIYQEFIIKLCECNNEKNKDNICLCDNNGQIIKVCNKCLVYFENAQKYYREIDEIMKAVMDNKKYLISDDLIKYCQLDKIHLNQEIVKRLSNYHYNHKEINAKLNRKKKIDIDDEQIDKTIAEIKAKYGENDVLDMNKETFFDYNKDGMIGITDEQKEGLYNIYKFIINKDELMMGLYGCAGTGKTTLIKYIIQMKSLNDIFTLIELDKCDRKNGKKIMEILYTYKNIVLASPTNKALDVIREKVMSIPNFILKDNSTGYINDLRIIFMTITKLLTHFRFYDKEHNITFKRGFKYENIIDKHNLIIIDESSMVNKDNLQDILNDISNTINNKGKIIYTGDKAQLPPPKEKYSEIFKLQLNKIELEEIVRTNKERIKDLSTILRIWQEKEIRNIKQLIMNHECDYIKFYKTEEDFVYKFVEDNDAIILVWTNDTRLRYNKIVRKILFGDELKKAKYVVNEHLIFNNFYKLTDDIFFYSSMPIIVANIDIVNNYKCKLFETNNIMAVIYEKHVKEQNLEHSEKLDIEQYCDKFINKFNKSVNMNFKIWSIHFVYKKELQDIPMKVIYDKKDYTHEIENGKKYVKAFFDDNMTQHSETIRDIIIELFDEYYIQPFADVDYGYAMTVDKSQGSTFSNVYIDSLDIIDRSKHPYLDMDTAKRRLYTGITRASDMIHMLV